VGLGQFGVQAGKRRPIRVARTLGAGLAGMVLVVGTITALDAAAAVVGTTSAVANLSCNDTWTGAAATTDWNTATNWSAGVPQSTSADACITDHATVVVSDASFSIGELTVSAGSSLTVDGGGPGATAASLGVSSGLDNDGTLIAGASASTGNPDLTLDGPITNTGALMVDGTVALGESTGTGTGTGLLNDGTVAVGPGGLIDLGTSSTITNGSDGVLAFGIDGPPSAASSYGRISNGTLSLAGTVDPVFEGGYTPTLGSEYVVDTGNSSGAFTSVLHDATVDYSHPGEVGLIGGAPAAATSTSVTSSAPGGSRQGQGVRLTATVTPSSGSDPTGSVTFSAGGHLLGSAPVTTGAAAATATLDSASLPVGSESIAATYSGDVFFNASTSSVVTQVVNPDPTNITITPSSADPEPGQAVSYTATVGGTGTVTPTGTVSFTDDGDPVPGCQSLSLPTSAPLQATCTESYRSTTTHSIVAVYSGDDDDAGSTATLVETLGQVPTQTTVATSSPTSTYGQSVTMTATVTPTQSGSVSPSGTVTFYDYETTPIATVGVSTVAGVTTATLDTSNLMSGPHSISATYSGDPTFSSSSSAAPVGLTVAEATTTVTVASSTQTSVVGQALLFTVTISSSASGETGTVQFDDNGSTIGSGSVSGGQATLQTGSLSLGAHPITAVYEGDDDFVGSSSVNTVIQTVGQASTATNVTSNDDPGSVGQTINYSATVTVDDPGTGTPTGTVSFSDGGSPIATCQGVALPATPPLQVTCTQAYDTAASHTVTAAYGGDPNFITSTGSETENVAPVSTTTSVVPSPPTSTYGQSVTLTATVTPTSGAADPDGTVTFTADGTTLGSSTLSTTGGVPTASMLSTTLPVGTDSVTASFDGVPGFLASSSDTAAPVDVSRAPTSLGLLTSTSPSTSAQAVTFTATVFPATGSGETGTVTFFDNGGAIGTGSVSNGQATLSTTALPVGTDLITAGYDGDGDFVASSTTGALSQAVNDPGRS
jgi:hypothetical protein